MKRYFPKIWNLPAQAGLKSIISLLLFPLFAYTLYAILHTLYTPRPPSLKSGPGNTLYVASNKTYTSAIGTKDGSPAISFNVDDAQTMFVLSGAGKSLGKRRHRSPWFRDGTARLEGRVHPGAGTGSLNRSIAERIA